MPDPRVDAVVRLVARVEGAACWLAAVATKGALAGGAAGLVLWWFTVGERLSDWWQGTASSLLVLALCQLVAPSFWLLTLTALAAVPVVIVLAAVAALVVSG